MTSGDTVTVLRAARELLSDEARWARHDAALDSDGNAVGSLSGEATCWCLFGSLERCAGEPLYEASGAVQAILSVFDASGSSHGIPDFNDHPDTTHADVLKVLDEAIERAER